MFLVWFLQVPERRPIIILDRVFDSHKGGKMAFVFKGKSEQHKSGLYLKRHEDAKMLSGKMPDLSVSPYPRMKPRAPC